MYLWPFSDEVFWERLVRPVFDPAYKDFEEVRCVADEAFRIYYVGMNSKILKGFGGNSVLFIPMEDRLTDPYRVAEFIIRVAHSRCFLTDSELEELWSLLERRRDEEVARVGETPDRWPVSLSDNRQ